MGSVFAACDPSGGGGSPNTPTPPTPPPKPKAWHVSIFAGSEATGGVDGTGTAASFTFPYWIAQSGTTLYVTDRSLHSIRTISTTTAQVGTIVNGGGLFGGDTNGDGTTAEFKNPTGVVAAGGGTLYIADSGNHLIREVSVGATAAATQVSLLAGTSGTAGHVDNATGTAAQFNQPVGLAISDDGNTLYVADSNGHRIRAIDLASPNKAVSTIAGSGTAGHADGTGTAAQFNGPTGLAVSGTTLYVADSGNHRIRAIDLASANKTVSTIAGSGTPEHADGAGTAARFNEPLGIAVSGTTLYITDSGNHRIRAVDIATRTVSTIAGDGTAETKDGLGIAARFRRPVGIAVSGSTIYVSTISGRRIRKLEYREVD